MGEVAFSPSFDRFGDGAGRELIRLRHRVRIQQRRSVPRQMHRHGRCLRGGVGTGAMAPPLKATLLPVCLAPPSVTP